MKNYILLKGKRSEMKSIADCSGQSIRCDDVEAAHLLCCQSLWGMQHYVSHTHCEGCNTTYHTHTVTTLSRAVYSSMGAATFYLSWLTLAVLYWLVSSFLAELFSCPIMLELVQGSAVNSMMWVRNTGTSSGSTQPESVGKQWEVTG